MLGILLVVRRGILGYDVSSAVCLTQVMSRSKRESHVCF